jgi:hypothetical protein
MKKKLSALELELHEAGALRLETFAVPLPEGEAMRMLARRGLRPEKTPADVPFPPQLDPELADRIAACLGHYAFRLFLRGVIRRSAGFLPAETTRYLTAKQSENYAGILVDLGIGERISRGRYRLKWPARSFGGTLEWYVARELERRFGFEVATGVKLHTRGAGGDLDVVAAVEGKLIYLELKSSPPKNLAVNEVAAFFDRLNLLRPDLSLFVVDTALRLSDKVVPMLLKEGRSRGLAKFRPKLIGGQLWSITPSIYAVNGSRDLMGNIGRAIAAGLLAKNAADYSDSETVSG